MTNEAAERRTYTLPLETERGRTISAEIQSLTDLEAWCRELGIPTRGTRIDRYRRYLEWRIENDQPFDVLEDGIFVDPPDTPLRHGLDRYLYVLREVHELSWIVRALRTASVKGIGEKLACIVSGSDFAALDRNSESRNVQFELRIASYFARNGYEIDLTTLTDIVASRQRVTYHVECKRVASPKQLSRRIKDALAQLRARLPRSTLTHSHYGLVAADVTKVAFAHNGLTRGYTPQHARDVLQDKLRAISKSLATQSPAITAKHVVGLLLQIHIASMIETPPQPSSRFSSLFTANPKLGLRAKAAEQRLWREFTGIDTDGDNDAPPQSLQLRKGVHIPEGLQVSWDEDLLNEALSGAAIKPRAADHVVMSIRPPDDEENEEFLYADFEFLMANLSDQERAEAFGSLDQARIHTLGHLLLHRYPYEGMPSWLDTSVALPA